MRRVHPCRNAAGALITSLQGTSDTNGSAVMKWKTCRTQAPDSYTGKVVTVLKSGYQFNAGAGVTTVSFTIQ